MLIVDSKDSAWTTLRNVVLALRLGVAVPERDCWKQMDDTEIWRKIVGQVAVVGASAPWVKLKQGWDAGEDALDLSTLSALMSTDGEEMIEGRIAETFKKYGVRYHNKKASSLAKNLAQLVQGDGPRAFIESVAKESDERVMQDRVAKAMSYIGRKGSRDMLMGLGLCRSAIALDVRIIGVLKAAGIVERAPKGKDEYHLVENALLKNVCGPLHWDGVELDRTLYQRYEEAKLAVVTGQLPTQQVETLKHLAVLEARVEELQAQVFELLPQDS